MQKGYSDWVHQARVFPGPSGSRPARSLIYTQGGDIYKATIGRPRRRYPGRPPPGSRAARATRAARASRTSGAGRAARAGGKRVRRQVRYEPMRTSDLHRILRRERTYLERVCGWCRGNDCVHE